MAEGVALQNLTSEDIALMLSGKFGTARNLTVLLRQKKVRCSIAKLCIFHTSRVPRHNICATFYEHFCKVLRTRLLVYTYGAQSTDHTLKIFYYSDPAGGRFYILCVNKLLC